MYAIIKKKKKFTLMSLLSNTAADKTVNEGKTEGVLENIASSQTGGELT